MYTIRLITFSSGKEEKKFVIDHEIEEETLIYPIEDRFRVIYGVFNDKEEAKIGIEGLSDRVKVSQPFVNHVITLQQEYVKSLLKEGKNATLSSIQKRKEEILAAIPDRFSQKQYSVSLDEAEETLLNESKSKEEEVEQENSLIVEEKSDRGSIDSEVERVKEEDSENPEYEKIEEKRESIKSD